MEDRFLGKRLDGRYEIREIIGVGGMAVVYKAYDNVEDRIVAIKILKDEFVSNEEFIRRFKNESKAIAVLSHPNIVKVYDVSFGDLIQYIVMEYIDGITLKEYIERQGSLRWQDALYFTVQILKGLQHAHDKGIVHRDVKPQNIIVLSDGTIKVTDFGIARFARSEQRTITDKAIGSVHYISPEQAKGEKTDEKADIYSVGVMLYEMLTGALPFEADSAVSVAIMQLQREPKKPSEINPSIPLGLEQITMHAMQKSTDRRYQSAAEMLCDLEVFRKDPTETFDYNYFVDNSPTKYVDNSIVSATPASLTMNGENENVEEQAQETKTKNATIPILAGIAATFVVVIAVVIAIVIKSFSGSTGKEISCPDFVGKTVEEIEQMDEYKDKVFEIKFEFELNDEYERNTVFKQEPLKDKKIKKGAKIILYTSSGKSTVNVPDVYGQKLAFAETELKAAGFETEIIEVDDESVDEGLVAYTDPPKTSAQAPGTKVKVYVSGGQSKQVDVPNVVGLTEEQAKADLTEKGLNVKVEKRDLTADEKSFKAGYVISQTPDSSQSVAKGTAVTIYVSTGVVNYNYDLKIDMTDDIKEIRDFVGNGKISLWVDGKLIKESEELDFSKSSYTFKGLSATDKDITVVVKINKRNYQEIFVDASTGRYTVLYEYEEWDTAD
ncbi:MAG: Stk1 family PASTA domain-containing Ser/Thr kinase [Clostridia bacterium]|nr:Stk1 family PASTA domain-containing Ser/Thr kinase [Clostridia bacterium]